MILSRLFLHIALIVCLFFVLHGGDEITKDKRRRPSLSVALARPAIQTQATLAAMFGGTRPRGPCQGMRNGRTKHRMCRHDAAVKDILQLARKMAVNTCQEMFEFDRWNCSIEYGKTYFFARDKVYRETALMHAMSAAALTHSIARACAEGKMSAHCRCAEMGDGNAQSAEAVQRTYRMGGCGDNVQYGRRFTRQFLQLKLVGDDVLGNTLRHNIEVGIKVVAHELGEVCKCHGISGSCVTKTCWRRLAPFTQTAAILKTRYHAALNAERDANNRASRRSTSSRTKTRASSPLVYLEKSSSFCTLTRGRRCLEPDNCATLCCGRGYNVQLVNKTRACHCRWKSCCYALHCDKCAYLEEVYTCK